VIVDREDASILNPTKFVGPFYTEEQLEKIKAERNWIIKYDEGRGYRRVVPSPIPLKIVEKNVIKQLVDSDVVVITAGGGGAPVYVEDDGKYEGVDGVIDKDRAAAILARDIAAQELYILTAVEKVALNYRKPNQLDLTELSVAEAKKYLTDGQFPKGSMGPKIESAINFIENGGEVCVITSAECLPDALAKKNGTRIVK
ncbi:MAG: carbamate kinase, partial [bacterium]|nr:carbamate kinase [bacterium]